MHGIVTVEIPAPRDVVWGIAQNPNRRHEWDLRIRQYQVTGLTGVGSEILMTVNLGVTTAEVHGRMMRWAPPHQSAFQAQASSSPLTPLGAGSWTFEEIEGGTRLTSRFTLDHRTLPWWVSRHLYAYIVKWDTERSFRRLRRLVMREWRGRVLARGNGGD